MSKDKELNNALEECLERVLKSETLEQCLADFPEYTTEIEPLLRTALAVKKASAVVPSPEFKAKARYQFHSALRVVKPQRRVPLLGWQPRWAIAIAAVLVVLLSAGGTVVAAANSMPDSFLYPVKLVAEQARLKFTISNLDKAELCAELADNRVAEIVYIVNKGESGKVEAVAGRLNDSLTMMASLTATGKQATLASPPVPQLPASGPTQKSNGGTNDGQNPQTEQDTFRVILERRAAEQTAELSAALEKAPESARPALRQAIDDLTANYARAIGGLE
jgi:hypothetical protein